MIYVIVQHGGAAMGAGQWFWIVYVICLLVTGWSNYPFQPGAYRPFVGSLVLYILIGLLGWGVFGPPIR
jgi:hypothetical protein